MTSLRPPPDERGRSLVAGIAILLGCVGALSAQPLSFEQPDGYRSPYAFRFTLPEAQRAAGWNTPPWSTPDRWSILPREDWYHREAYRLRSFENLAYGARPIDFPPPMVYNASPQWERERVLTAAERLVGMHYQHHHIPAFDPYPSHPEWPWLKVRSGLRGRGLDCSNFVSWVYNYALGIRLSGSVKEASEQTAVRGPGDATTRISVLPGSAGVAFEDFVATLRPGDIVYVRSDRGFISHCVLWIGDALAADANGKDKFFLIDSTGPGEIDSNGARMPDGVQIRPFRRDSWYFHNAAFVHRVIVGP
jgi:cell wall-associated NlpC family hydrolase